MTSIEFAKQYYENIKFSSGGYTDATKSMATEIDKHFRTRSTFELTSDQLINFAMAELWSVQLVDNTNQQAIESRKEIKAILETVIKMAQE